MIDDRLTAQHDTDSLALIHPLDALSDEFLTWVVKYGGASVRPELAMPDDDGNGILDQFLSKAEIVSTYNSTGGFAEVIPTKYVMVGYGPGCGLCISIDEKDAGTVWFADFDLADDIVKEGSRSNEIMMKLADSWTEFLASR